MKPHLRRLMLWLTMAVLLLVALIQSWPFEPDATPAETAGSWQPLSAEVQTQELTASGKVIPVRVVDIASPANGVIDSLQVNVGDSVKQGDPLGRIASSELQVQLRTAQAAFLRGQLQDGAELSDGVPTELLNAQRRVLTAKTALSTARAREAESSELYNKGIVSRNDDEAAKSAVTDAQMQLAQAQEELKAAQRKFAPDQLQAVALEQANKRAEWEQLQDRQKRLPLVAPLSGVVLYPQASGARGGEGLRELVTGARVAADEAVMAIGDTSSYLIRAFCTEAEFAWLQEGAEAQITLTALPQETFQSQVVKVLGQTRARMSSGFGEETYEFLVALPAPGQTLPPAFRDKIRIDGTAKLKVTQQGSRRQTTVPTAAVVWAADGSAQVRWRASAQEAPQMRPVRVASADANNVMLREELAGEVWVPGQEVGQPPSEDGAFKRLLGWEE
jgi:HlyD family secretion protein